MFESRRAEVRSDCGKLLERQGAHIVVRLSPLALDNSAVLTQLFAPRTQVNTNAGKLLPRIGTVQRAERYVGNAHFVTGVSGQETEPEYLKSVDGRHPVQIFVDGADQHLSPEALNGSLG